MRRVVGLLCSCMLVVVLGAMPVSALPVLSLQAGGTTVTVVDGSALDWDTTEGVVAYVGSVGNFVLNVSTGTSKPIIGSEAYPELALWSVDVASGQGTLIVSFTEDGFVPLGPAPTTYESTISGWSSSGTVSYSTSLTQSSGTTSLGSETYASGYFNGVFESSPVTTTSPYSLMQTVTMSLSGPLSKALFSAELRAVPEPASLALFGTGLVGLAALARRARRKRAS